MGIRGGRGALLPLSRHCLRGGLPTSSTHATNNPSGGRCKTTCRAPVLYDRFTVGLDACGGLLAADADRSRPTATNPFLHPEYARTLQT